MGISVKRFPLICEEMPTKGHQGSSLVGKNCLHNFLEACLIGKRMDSHVFGREEMNNYSK